VNIKNYLLVSPFIYFRAESRAQWPIKKSEIQDKKEFKRRVKPRQTVNILNQ